MDFSKSNSERPALGDASCAPALFTSPMIGPFAATFAIASTMDDSLVISHTRPRPTGQVPLRDSAAIRKPRRSSSTAMASPMPRLPPVTMICASLIAEYPLAPLGKGSHALFRIGRAKGQSRQIRLYLNPPLNRDDDTSDHS